MQKKTQWIKERKKRRPEDGEWMMEAEVSKNG